MPDGTSPRKGMYQVLRRSAYVKSGRPFYRSSFTHLICPRHPRCDRVCARFGKSTSVRLRICSMGISPLPGTPPAAHFCYGSIIILRACSRPRRVQPGLRRVSWIAHSLIYERRSWRTHGVGLTVHRRIAQVTCLLNGYSIFKDLW